MLLPSPRGSLSRTLFRALRSAPGDGVLLPPELEPDSADDAAVALWACHELHYRGFDDVDDAREWDPAVLALRVRLERELEARLRARYRAPDLADDFAEGFFDWVAGFEGPSLASYVHREASREEVLDLLRIRSIYHLKESDPTAWVLPRLDTVPKAALMEVLTDEYGGGDPNRLHHHLFARGMEACGLTAEYGAYLDEAPVEALEQNNAMSLFGLHRRLRGAALGHLAAFEATSSMPSRRMAQGLQRLELADEMVEYYTEHVEADAVHEQLAVRDICGALVEREPQLLDDVLFGAFTSMDLEARFASRMLLAWSEQAA